MRHAPQLLLAFVVSITSAQSAPSICGLSNDWFEASYVQRTTWEGADAVAEAEMRAYANANFLRANLMGTPVSMITMTSKGAEGVVLMSSRDPGGPETLAEVSMLFEPPMAHGALRGLAGPCDLVDGETRDLSGLSDDPAILSGSVTRHGPRITYTVRWRDALGPDRVPQQFSGIWERAAQLPVLPLSMDVSNWRVYRNNVLLKVADRKTRPLGALLEEIGAAPAAR